MPSEPAEACCDSLQWELRTQTTLTPRTLCSEYQKAEQLLEPGADAGHSALGLCFANFAVPGGADAVDTALALKPRAVWL